MELLSRTGNLAGVSHFCLNGGVSIYCRGCLLSERGDWGRENFPKIASKGFPFMAGCVIECDAHHVFDEYTRLFVQVLRVLLLIAVETHMSMDVHSTRKHVTPWECSC